MKLESCEPQLRYRTGASKWPDLGSIGTPFAPPATGPHGTLPGKVSCQWAEIRDFQRWNQAILAISTAKHPVHLDKIPIVSFISSINKWFQGSILSIIYFYEFIASRLITIFQNGHLRLAPPSFAGHTWRLRPQAAVFVDHRVLTCAIRKEIVYIRYMSSLYTYTYIYIYIL